MSKLKRTRHALNIWNRTIFGNVDQRICALQEDLAVIQRYISEHGYNDFRFDREVSIQADLNMILEQKDRLWKQKSRSDWLRDDDRNTSFFHATAKFRHAKSSISSVVINNVISFDQDVIANHILDFYMELFTEQDPIRPCMDRIQQLILPCVSNEDGAMISRIPDYVEIKAAVFSLDANSAPGPDDFGGSFFHARWSIIESNVCDAVQTFFRKGYLPSGLNSSKVILLPKKDVVQEVTDFWLIILSNFFFKIFSKILATRLGAVLDKVITPNQFGFISGCSIHDCIVLGSEGVNCLDRVCGGKNMACKIDIWKAFDTLRWDFLLHYLDCFGFPEIFIGWIRAILHSSRISIVFNGQMKGYFPCSRGVRQGDPLSPLLFG